MEASVELITPGKALAWLEGAARNRTISDAAVRRYGADMLAGRWELNGQGLIFDSNGKLVDGRHRLTAIVATGCEVQMLVVRGAKPEAFETMDSGRGRTLAHVLSIEGRKNATMIASAARMVWAYVAGGSIKYGTSRAELLDLVRRHPIIDEYTTLIENRGALTRPLGLPKSGLIAVLALANGGDRRHDKAVADFIEGLVTGEGLFQGDPRLTLRRWLARQRAEVGFGGSRIAEPFFAATVKAWNAFVVSDNLANIRLPTLFNRETLEIKGFDRQVWSDVADMPPRTPPTAGGSADDAWLSDRFDPSH